MLLILVLILCVLHLLCAGHRGIKLSGQHFSDSNRPGKSRCAPAAFPRRGNKEHPRFVLYLHPCEGRATVDLVACDGGEPSQVSHQHLGDQLGHKHTHTGVLLMHLPLESPLQAEGTPGITHCHRQELQRCAPFCKSMYFCHLKDSELHTGL